ncbi:hypothetical protein NAT51_14050 [Flavobacterium amniphilum]|uniref:hypothetical protein n=1 Tax=Flavobacterium amniphilum TaxID=1834035 RepID=UPI00202A1C66|nr:hypothetical protein [Flavobacterium amniphilum]MCL9806654.1 hypothetical protein [Flavobacterium amniphilum]
MKTVSKFFLNISLFFILLCTNVAFPQSSKPVIKETECIYSEQYTKPKQITFAFYGNLEYANYYFADLKEHLNKLFTKKGIRVNFTDEATDETIFTLKVDNSKIIHENGGYDREISYELEGTINKNNTAETLLSFKINVNTVHDINQQNKKVAEYLLGKVLKKD